MGCRSQISAPAETLASSFSPMADSASVPATESAFGVKPESELTTLLPAPVFSVCMSDHRNIVYLNIFFLSLIFLQAKELNIKITVVTIFPQILLLIIYTPDSEFVMQWNNTHNQTLSVFFLILAKAKLNPKIFIPNAK